MKMSQIVQRTHDILDAATGTYLTSARVYTYDFPMTVETANTLLIKIIPQNSQERGEYISGSGWYVPFTVLVEATIPHVWSDVETMVKIAEELLGVFVNNRDLTITNEAEAASMYGDAAGLRWDYGYVSEGEQSEYKITLLATWVGPQISPD